MRRFLSLLLCLGALTMFLAGSRGICAAARLTVEAPAGFDELASKHVVLVDVYFGGEKIAETIAVTRPGSLSFQNPDEIVRRIPRAIVTPELKAAIAQDLATNSEHVCAQSNTNACGVLSPELLAIIYDEDRFRVDIFVNPKFLSTASTVTSGYLPRPDSALSLTDTVALDASGTIGGKSTYDIQNRTIIARQNMRIRADTAIASHIGVLVDDLVAEEDENGLRYSGGLFWAPANDFIGQRRILGGGVSTQFDTWADHESLRSTPLITFLAEPARIDLIVDGRLVSSRSYGAGNVEIDTSGLPEGSYPVVLHILGANGRVEEQRRFFVKNAQLPVRDHPMVYAFAGVLANTRENAPISPSRTLFYELGTARRISNSIGLDVAALGTQHKSMVEGGSWLIASGMRVRAAALVSSSGDWGALFQLGTSGTGPFSMSIDVRRIWSRDSAPLVPLASSISSFDIAPPAGVQLALGSYTQATASMGFHFLNGFVSFVGSYRKDRSFPADYTMGPSLSLPVVMRNDLQVVFDASAQRSRASTAAFAGMRLLLSSKHLSVGGSLGRASEADRSDTGSASSRTVGSVSVQWSEERRDETQVTLQADADRNIETSTIHAEGVVNAPFGDVRADLLKNVEDRHMPQYNLAFQSGMALGTNASTWGSRELEQSAVIVAVNGDAVRTGFTVIVNGIVRGKLEVGHRLALFLPAYRTYRVRIRPTEPQNISFDGAEREITLYPGNVRTLSWSADSLVTLFGQATTMQGTPIANALVQSARSIAETDESGYFQIDARHDDSITIAKPSGASCKLNVGKIVANNDFASVGKVICQ